MDRKRRIELVKILEKNHPENKEAFDLIELLVSDDDFAIELFTYIGMIAVEDDDFLFTLIKTVQAIKNDRTIDSQPN